MRNSRGMWKQIKGREAAIKLGRFFGIDTEISFRGLTMATSPVECLLLGAKCLAETMGESGVGEEKWSARKFCINPGEPN